MPALLPPVWREPRPADVPTRVWWDWLLVVVVPLVAVLEGTLRADLPFRWREEEILAAVARGRSNDEIARELHIALSTVKTHVGSLMAKLGVRNRVELAIWAYETRRVPPRR